MVRHVGFPVELLDMAKLKEHFSGIEMKPDKFFDNYVQIGKWWMKNKFGKLREKVNKTDWKDHANPAMVNAMYNPVENAIMLPAGILQVLLLLLHVHISIVLLLLCCKLQSATCSDFFEQTSNFLESAWLCFPHAVRALCIRCNE